MLISGSMPRVQIAIKYSILVFLECNWAQSKKKNNFNRKN